MKNVVAVCLVLAGCSGGTGLRPGETCGDWAPCALSSGRSFRLCGLQNARDCRLLTTDGNSFPCASCEDCSGAEAQAAGWCLGGARTFDLGANGDLAFSQPSGDLARPSEQCSPTTPRATAPEVSVLPEDGEAPYVNVLMKAQKDIRVSAYLMGYGGILDTLEAKAAAGVKVRAILDVGQDANLKYYDLMKAAGMEVLWSDMQFPYYHAKYMVVDGTEAVLSTGNYSKNYSVQRERNFVVHLNDPYDVADLVTIFDADWSRQSPTLSCTRLLVSPINTKDRLLAFISSAQRTLDIESMQFADTDIRAAVAARKLGGVEVRALLAAPSWIDANTDAANFLKARGIPVKWMSAPGVHVKAMVADGERAYMGSVNISYTSISKNREVGLVLIDSTSVAPIKSTFERDWAAATSF
jgi:phosphatidylserine/phosphatidylglycerophosphate/cardiolipin synthase-like enzyme